jgi:hypothetical protein
MPDTREIFISIGMVTSDLHLLIGWIAMLLGVLSGAVIGLFFHLDDWAGGYRLRG